MSTFARKRFAGSLFESGENTKQVGLVVDEILGDQIIETFEDGDTTPSVATPNALFKISNTGATTITDLDDGYSGQVVTVLFGDANTTVDFTASGLVGNGGADWTPAVNDSMRCIYDGTDWYCCVCDASGGGGSAIPDGTADGQMLVWDQTTDQAWEVATNLSWSETDQRMTIGAAGFQIGFDGFNSWGLFNSSGTQFLKYTAGVTIYDDAGAGEFRIAEDNFLRIHGNGGSFRASIYSDTYLHFGSDSSAPLGAQFHYPLNMVNTGTRPAAPPNTGLMNMGGVFWQQTSGDFSAPISTWTDNVWRFNSPTTAADPGNTFMRANTNDINTFTELYFDDNNYAVDDQGWWFSYMAVGDVLHLFTTTDRNRWASVRVDSITDNTGWWTLGITILDSGGSGAGSIFLNGVAVHIKLQRASTIAGTGAPANGTATGNTLYWDGAAWVENANVVWNPTNASLVLPSNSDPNTPTLAFGDGDTGFYELSDDTLRVSIGTNARWQFANDHFSGSSSASGALLLSPTRTKATVRPHRSWNHGLGADSITEMSVICSGQEMIRLETNALLDSVILQYPLQIKESAGIASTTGYGQIWTGFDGSLNYKNDTGTNYILAPTGQQTVTWASSSGDTYSSGSSSVFNSGSVQTLEAGSIFEIQEAATMADPAAGYGRIWVRDDTPNVLMFTDDAGDDFVLNAAAGATTLAALTDTTITTPAEGGLLMWDSTPGEWVDATTLTGPYTLSGFCIFSGNETGNALRADNDIQLSDAAALKFGTGAGGAGDILMQWDGVDLEVTGIGSNYTFNWRDGIHHRLWDSTDTDWFDMHVSGAALVITESGLTSVQWPAAGTLDLDMNDNAIQAAILQDYSIESSVDDVSGTTVTFAYANGPVFECDMEAATGNVTATLSGGPPAGTHGQITVKMTQDTTVRTLSWAGGTFRWAGGTAHPITTTANGFSIYTFETWDGGTTWYAAGADYS